MDLTTAKIELEAELAIAPSAILHLKLAHIYAEKQENHIALKHYHQALLLEPESGLAHYKVGKFFLQQNNHNAAIIQFNNVVTLQENHMQAWFYLGVLHLAAEDLTKASHALLQVVKISPENIEALVNLGVIALKSNQGQLAIDWFTKALAQDPKHLEARNNLAATFMHYDRFENALTYYNELLEETPNQAEYLYNAGVAEMALGHLHAAMSHFESLLLQNSTYKFAACNNLAAIQLRLGHKTYAISLLQQALKIDKTNNATRFMLQALTGEKITTPCLPYVEQLFNNYAFNYDQHLQVTLEYKLPQHIAKLLHLTIDKNNLATLDLGCGTGLCGSFLREISSKLIGVDIAAKMLAEAKIKNLYDKLIDNDICTFLHADNCQYDLIVASDVLPYIGDIAEFMQLVYTRLAVNGRVIFTVEINETPGVNLQENMRFCHYPADIDNLSTKQGFTIINKDTVVARKQQAQDVPVILYCLQKLKEK